MNASDAKRFGKGDPLVPRKWIALAILTAAILVAASSAASAARFGGRYTTQTQTVNGTTVKLTAVTNFNPPSGECIVQSLVVLMQKPILSDNRQLQAGLLRCNNQTIDPGGCRGGRIVVERYFGSYHCYEHGTFTNGTPVTVTINRSGLSPDTFIPYINGTPYNAQGGFTDYTTALTWGEYTGGACNGWGAGLDMQFQDWQRLTGSWSYASGAEIPDTPSCFNVGNPNSTGDFHVTK